MAERVRKILDGKAAPTIRTFHSFAARWLRTQNKSIVILDENDSFALWRKASGGDPRSKELYYRYQYATNFPEADEAGIISQLDKGDQKKYWAWKTAYMEKLQEQNAVDFQQIILQFVEAQKAGLTPTFKRIAVDEFQDTSAIQFEMIRGLTAPDGIVVAVGDQDQILYHWRGADETNVKKFIEHFDPEVIKLEDNYRSAESVCEVCNNIIAHNLMRIKKSTKPVRSFAGSVTIMASNDEMEQSHRVAEMIRRDIRQGLMPEDIAVLARTSFAIPPLLETDLKNFGIPCIMVSNFSFFDREEIKAVLGLMKFIVNPKYHHGLQLFMKFVAVGVGPKKIDELPEDLNLKEWADANRERTAKWVQNLVQFFDMITSTADHKPVDQIKAVLTDSGAYERLKALDEKESTNRGLNVKRLVEGILPAYSTLTEAVDCLTLAVEGDLEDETNTVKIMTVHAAKGLEFKVVYVVGLEEEVFPHKRSLAEDGHTEGERRCFFVACSRAKDTLRLCWVRRRNVPSMICVKSRFLDELERTPEDASVCTDSEGGRRARKHVARDGASGTLHAGPTLSEPDGTEHNESDGSET